MNSTHPSHVSTVSRPEVPSRSVQFLLVFTETLWTRSLADPEAKDVTYVVAAGVNGNLTFT